MSCRAQLSTSLLVVCGGSGNRAIVTCPVTFVILFLWDALHNKDIPPLKGMSPRAASHIVCYTLISQLGPDWSSFRTYLVYGRMPGVSSFLLDNGNFTMAAM